MLVDNPDSELAIDLFALIFGDDLDHYQRRYQTDPEGFSISLA